MNITTYILYLSISTIVILYVGNLCYNNGKVYLSSYFPKHLSLGERINRLLRLAYYLLNIGLTVFCLYSIKNIENIEMMFIEISTMIGFILLVIGILHFNNILMIYLLHKHYKK